MQCTRVAQEVVPSLRCTICRSYLVCVFSEEDENICALMTSPEVGSPATQHSMLYVYPCASGLTFFNHYCRWELASQPHAVGGGRAVRAHKMKIMFYLFKAQRSTDTSWPFNFAMHVNKDNQKNIWWPHFPGNWVYTSAFTMEDTADDVMGCWNVAAADDWRGSPSEHVAFHCQLW